MSATVEYLTWLHQHNLAGGPPLSTRERAALRDRRLDNLAHQIEHTETAVAHADDRIWRRRMERKLERLEAQRDQLEAEGWELEALAFGWPWRCAECDARLAQTESDYGIGRCVACRTPTPRRL